MYRLEDVFFICDFLFNFLWRGLAARGPCRQESLWRVVLKLAVPHHMCRALSHKHTSSVGAKRWRIFQVIYRCGLSSEVSVGKNINKKSMRWHLGSVFSQMNYARGSSCLALWSMMFGRGNRKERKGAIKAILIQTKDNRMYILNDVDNLARRSNKFLAWRIHETLHLSPTASDWWRDVWLRANGDIFYAGES